MGVATTLHSEDYVRSGAAELSDPRTKLGLRPIINAAGTMTALGASAAVPEAIAAAAELLPWFVEIDDLQRLASQSIARITGAEAGMVTASSAAAITLAVAACMTGADPGAIEQLPDVTGLRSKVVIQAGHLIDYGAPVDQAIRLSGGRVACLGQATSTGLHQLEAALDGDAAAALYVVSHHTVRRGEIGLPEFVAACRARSVPVIVDAASEYDLTGFVAAGADLVIYSAHKFLGGLTAGIVCGRKGLVQAVYLQNGGIGRGFKVGKEGIAATIAALEAWRARDHAFHKAREEACVRLWLERLRGIPGVSAEASPDPTGNPITRVRLRVHQESGMTAWNLADALQHGARPVVVRDDEVDLGYFELDPCNLRDGEAEEVADRIVAEFSEARAGSSSQTSLGEWRAKRMQARLAWPD